MVDISIQSGSSSVTKIALLHVAYFGFLNRTFYARDFMPTLKTVDRCFTFGRNFIPRYRLFKLCSYNMCYIAVTNISIFVTRYLENFKELVNNHYTGNTEQNKNSLFIINCKILLKFYELLIIIIISQILIKKSFLLMFL